MKKHLAAVGLAAGAFFVLPHEASAEMLQSPDAALCAPVVNQLGGSSEALVSEISQYQLDGIDVHVQLLKNSREVGVSDEEEMSSFIEQLAVDCGWGKGQYLNIFVGLDKADDRIFYDAYEAEGFVDNLFPQSRVDEAVAPLIPVLKDVKAGRRDASDIVGASAQLLRDLDPSSLLNPNSNGGTSGQGAYDPESLSPSDEAANDGPSIPFLFIGEVAGGVLIAGALGARGWRHRTVSSLYRTASQSLTDAQTALADIEGKSAEQLAILPEDDADDLDNSHRQVEADLAGLGEISTKALITFRNERRRLWPSTDVVTGLAHELGDYALEFTNNAKEAASLLAEVEKHRKTNDVNAPRLVKMIADIKLDIEDLKRDGWNVVGFEEQLGSITETRDEIHRLIGLHYIEKPGDLLDDAVPAAVKLTADVMALPARRVQADQLIPTQRKAIADKRPLIDGSQTVFTGLTETYDMSCYQDLAEVPAQMESIFTQLTDIQQSVEAQRGTKSLESVIKTEALEAQAQDLLSQVDTLAGSIHTREAKLLSIIADLDDNVRHIETTAQSVTDFANREDRDVEDATRQLIADLNADIAEFTSSQIHIAKPKYLALDKRMEELNNSIESVTTRAKQEKNEMVELRNAIEAKKQEAERELQSLRSYVNSNRGDVTVSATFSIPSADTSDSRQGLRAQVSDFDSVISDIESAHRRAKQQVAAAEEAARRRRQQEEDDRRRAAAAASSFSSSSGFSSFGGFDSGGGGGTHTGGSV